MDRSVDRLTKFSPRFFVLPIYITRAVYICIWLLEWSVPRQTTILHKQIHISQRDKIVSSRERFATMIIKTYVSWRTNHILCISFA